MKRNEILGEHKKGTKAVKYNRKPKDHTAEFGKAKEKLAPVKPMEGYNPNSAGAEHRRKLDQSHAADLKARAEGPDATDRDKQRYQNYLDKKEQMANDYNDRMEREGIEQEALYRRRGSSSAYDRDYASSVRGMDRGNNHRDDERHDLDPSDWYIVKDGKMYKTSVYPRDEQEAIRRGYSRTRDEANARAKSTDEAMGADVGKITKVDPATKKATLTKPDGTSMEVDSTALKPTPDGKMSMDTPDLKTGTAVVSTEAADVPYQVKQGPQPMAMTSPKPTAIVASKKWTAITPDIEAKATQQGFRKVMLKVNGQMVPGLEGGDQAMGSKIIVAPSDFENMTRTGNAGTARRPMGVTSAEKTGIGAPPLRESDKALLDKMLTIAGIR